MSPGTYTYILLGMIVYLSAAQKRKETLVFIPAICVLLICLAPPVNIYLCYMLPIMAATPIELARCYFVHYGKDEVRYAIPEKSETVSAD